MSQAIFTSINPATTSGNQLAIILNDFKDAIVSGLSGTSRPAALQAGGFWVDITNDPSWVFKIYNGTTDTPVFTINTTTGTASISSADTLFEVAKVSDDAVGPIVRLLKERIAAGGQTVANDVLGEVQFSGTQNDGTNVPQARIKAIATQSTTSANQGSSIIVETKNTGSASFTEVMRVTEGKVGIGTTAPAEALHVVGNTRVDKTSDDTIPAKINLRKKRVAGGGQTLTNDIVGRVAFSGTDNAGVEAEMAVIEASAAENTTAAAMGSRMAFKIKNLTLNTYTEKMYMDNGGVTIPTLTVTNFFATNSTLGNVTETADASILVNKGGNTASADAVNSGFEIEIGGGTNAKFGYDSTKASKFVLGNVGALKEVADVSSVQTFTNKTLTAPVINNGTATGTGIITPSRLDAKQDTLANLQTYALTAANGQLVYATDTKQMFQVLDAALAAIGGGGGGADTFLYLDASEQLTGWALGDNATFLGGGTFTGTFVKETAAPLNGSASYKYTQNTSSLDEYIASPIFPVAKRFRGNQATLILPYNYDGNSVDIEPIIWDVTNSVKLTTPTNLLPSSPTTGVGIYRVNVNIPANCTQIRIGFQVKTLNNGKILQFDDIQMSSDATKYADLLPEDDGLISTVIFNSSTLAPNGFISALNSVIGATGSGAALSGTRYQKLYNILWAQAGTVTTASVPYRISTSKGASAAADWAANKTITIDYTSTGSFIRAKTAARDLGVYETSENLSHVHGATTYTASPVGGGNNPQGFFGSQLGAAYTTHSQGGAEAKPNAVSLNAWIRFESNPGVSHILTAADTVSSDTLPLTYAGSSQYTPSTLVNAPPGTFITHTYTSSSSTRIQTNAAPPTQSTSSMATDGIFITPRAFNATGSAATPAIFQIQIGKDFKGWGAKGYASSARASELINSFFINSGAEYGIYTYYDPTTGVFTIDGGSAVLGANTSRFSGVNTTTNASVNNSYWTINASKSPALLGLPNLAPRIATISDVKAAGGNDGGSSTSGAQTRVLNTLVDPTGIVTSLSSNQFTLPAGEYYIEATIPGYRVEYHLARLSNITDSSTPLTGTVEYTNNTQNIQTKSEIKGRISITSPKVFEISHVTFTATANNGLGVAYPASGSVNVYTTVKITKIR